MSCSIKQRLKSSKSTEFPWKSYRKWSVLIFINLRWVHFSLPFQIDYVKRMASYYLNFNETLTTSVSINDSTATINDSSLEDVCQNFHVNEERNICSDCWFPWVNRDVSFRFSWSFFSVLSSFSLSQRISRSFYNYVARRNVTVEWVFSC